MRHLRVTHVVLVLLCLMYFITYLDRVNVSTAAAGFATDFHLTKTQIGFVFSAFAYPYLAFQIWGGWISDRYGARRTLIACGTIWAGATILTGMATGLASLLIARLLLGIGEGATLPAAATAMSRWVPRGKRGFAQGLTHAAARIGNAVAPAAIVVIMAALGWRASFYACAVISFAWVALWALTFTEFPTDNPRVTQQELAALPRPPTTSAKAVRPAWFALFKRMGPVAAVYFCYGWNLWLFLSWIPQYFLHNYALDLQRSALFSSSVFFAGVVGDSLGGLVTDKVLRRSRRLEIARSWMVSVCLLLTGLSLVPLMFVHNVSVSLACLSAGFFFAEMTIGPMWAIPMDIAPDYSGTASGMMNTGSAAAAIVSPVVSGYLIDRFHSWESPFVCDMLLIAVGLVLTFRMRPEIPFSQATEAAPRLPTTVDTPGPG
jgi:ACS family glucarate transporter-like MFS transporter